MTWPIFVHCYLELVALEDREQGTDYIKTSSVPFLTKFSRLAQQLMRTHAPTHEALHDAEVAVLQVLVYQCNREFNPVQGVVTKAHMRQSELVQLFRSMVITGHIVTHSVQEAAIRCQVEQLFLRAPCWLSARKEEFCMSMEVLPLTDITPGPTTCCQCPLGHRW